MLGNGISARHRIWLICGIATVFVVIVFLFVQEKFSRGPRGLADEFASVDSNVCPGKAFPFKNVDVYVGQAFPLDQVVLVEPNYYRCHPVERGDYVVYRFSDRSEPVIRRVVAIPEDRFQLELDEKSRGWNLIVNGEAVVDLRDESPYFFGVPETRPPLSLAAEKRKGILASGEYIVLSTRAPGDLDSGMFGVVDTSSLAGRVRPSDGVQPKEIE